MLERLHHGSTQRQEQPGVIERGSELYHTKSKAPSAAVLAALKLQEDPGLSCKLQGGATKAHPRPGGSVRLMQQCWR